MASAAHLYKPSMNKPRKNIVFFLTMLIFRLFLSSTTIKNLDLHCQEIFITTTKHDNGVSFHTHRQGYSESRPFRRDGNTIHSSTLPFCQESTNINNPHLLECTLVQHSVNNITQSIHYCRTGNHHRWHSAIWKNKITCKQVVTWN